ncbi:MAG: S9 family peptidase [Sphingomonadaceae bacterium]|nr:S9 family peptidase [Sphingomonadaceae bacterium]
MKRALAIAILACATAAHAAVPAPERALTDPRSITSPQSPQAGPVSVAGLYDLKGGQGAVWTADGRSVVMSANLAGRFNLWRLSADGGEPVQLTKSDDRQGGPTMLRDGRVLYQQDRAGNEMWDLWAVPLAGGEPVNLTNTPDVIETGAEISRDGRFVAFGRRLKIAPQTNIAVMDLGTGEVRELTAERERDRQWSVVAITGDAHTIIASRGDFNRAVGEVYAIDVASGRARLLSKPGERVDAAAASPDGRRIAVTVETASGTRQAGVLDAATGMVRLLKPGVWEQSARAISPDGARIIFETNVDGRTTLSCYDVASGRVSDLPLNPGVNALAADGDKAFSPDGRRLIVSSQGGARPSEYYAYDLSTGKLTQLTRFAGNAVPPGRLPPTQIVHYRSADGTVISAVLTMPYNLKRDGTAPAVVLPHGGPTGQTVDSFSRTAAALASRGYVTLAPNPRGSTGYGRAFQDANIKDLGGGDLDDEVAGARWLAATGYVDAKRIGITGGSYGGYMTLMALGKSPDMWAAGVELFGIIDWVTMYRTEAPTLQAYQRGLLGEPDTEPEVYRRTSPMTYIGQVKAPLLVLQGDNDIRVPRGQAEQVVDAIRAKGGVVEATYYANEGHGFVKRENQIDSLQKTIDWFDRFLKPKR